MRLTLRTLLFQFDKNGTLKDTFIEQIISKSTPTLKIIKMQTERETETETVTDTTNEV